MVGKTLCDVECEDEHSHKDKRETKVNANKVGECGFQPRDIKQDEDDQMFQGYKSKERHSFN